MSAAARTPVKAPAKPGPQRPNAWTGSRASPTFSAAAASRPGFPALANGSDKDKIVSALSGVTGTAVTITTKPNTVYHGTVVAASSTTITLADVTQPNNPTAPVTPSLSLNPSDVLNWAPAQSPKDTFHTDTDISAKKGKGAERELQAWQPDQPANDGDAYDMSNTNGKQWDQFAANETMFGVTTSWDENQYTTPLDRSAPDFKEKERKAQMQANEIMNQQSSNPHIQEERIQNLTGDSGDKEEEKYSGVTRGAGAYVPPGARKPGSAAPTPPPAKPTGAAANNSDSNIPTVAVTKDDKDPKTPSDPTKAFKIFVDSEKERLKAKKTDLFKKDMNSKVADLLKFSQSFKLNKPIPDDLVPILAKDADKQRQIKEKSLNDAGSSQARAIGVSSPTASGSTKASAAGTNAARPTSRISPELKAAMKNMVIPERKPKPGETSTKPSAPVVAVVAAAPIPTPPVKATQSTGPPKAKVSASGKPLIPMHIPAIPAFKGKSQTPEKKETTPNGAANVANAKPALNINANSFKPNVAAKPFTPGGASPKPGNSPKPAHKEPAGPPNPFFGSRQLKKSTSHIKEDFNPFKHSRVADGATVCGFDMAIPWQTVHDDVPTSSSATSTASTSQCCSTSSSHACSHSNATVHPPSTFPASYGSTSYASKRSTTKCSTRSAATWATCSAASQWCEWSWSFRSPSLF
ncbi:LsmAD domain-containing protein [Flagelloscypha sp. PMI_526]|nr:LsmAD domain-containing protein [Flagelloscypha sp. PMI_526]